MCAAAKLHGTGAHVTFDNTHIFAGTSATAEEKAGSLSNGDATAYLCNISSLTSHGRPL